MTPDNNVVLTGFMGTGKTTVGRQLADELGYEFVDTDELIEQRHGPIHEIFATQGEEAFREHRARRGGRARQRRGLVIATGGRMMLDPENVRTLSAGGRIFCLVATPEEVLRPGDERCRSRRPAAVRKSRTPRRRIVELMTERDPEYRRFPQLVTDARAPDGSRAGPAGLWRRPTRIRTTSTIPPAATEFAVGAGLLPFVRQLAGIEGPIGRDHRRASSVISTCPARATST